MFLASMHMNLALGLLSILVFLSPSITKFKGTLNSFLVSQEAAFLQVALDCYFLFLSHVIASLETLLLCSFLEGRWRFTMK
eukprot:c21609_g2_i1 orf=295-537(+)